VVEGCPENDLLYSGHKCIWQNRFFLGLGFELKFPEPIIQKTNRIITSAEPYHLTFFPNVEIAFILNSLF